MRTVNRKHGLGLHRAAYPAPGKWEGDAGVGLGPRQQASQPRRVTAHRLVVCRAVMLGWGRWCGAWSVMGRRGKGGGGVGDGEVPLHTSANRGETANGAHRQAASCLISVQRALFDDLGPHYCTPAPLWAGSNTRNGIRPVAVLQDQWARAATGASSVRAMPKWAHCRCGGVTTTASSAAVVVADEAVGVVIGVAAAAALCSIVIRLRARPKLRPLVELGDLVAQQRLGHAPEGVSSRVQLPQQYAKLCEADVWRVDDGVLGGVTWGLEPCTLRIANTLCATTRPYRIDVAGFAEVALHQDLWGHVGHGALCKQGDGQQQSVLDCYSAGWAIHAHDSKQYQPRSDPAGGKPRTNPPPPPSPVRTWKVLDRCVSMWSILTLSPKSATLALTPRPSAPLLYSMMLRAWGCTGSDAC